MSEIEQLNSDLIGTIYEAAMDMDAWPRLLQQLTNNMHAGAAIFRVSDVISDKVHLGLTHGHEDSYLNAYRDYYIKDDPYRPALKRHPAGVFYPGQAALPYEELEKLELFELLMSSGLYYTLGGFAMRDGSLAYQLVVQRGKKDGDFCQEEIDRFNRLIPHLQRAFRINQHIAALKHQKEIAETSLDQLSTGVILIDEEGRAIHLNKKAEKILAAREGLCMVSGRLTASGLQDGSRLRQLIRSAIGKASDKTIVLSGAMCLMPESGEGQPLSILVTPLNSRNQERLEFLHKSACAAIFIGSPAHSGEPDVDVIRMLYGFTGAEARLAAALARGYSLNEISERFRISCHTARSHLKAIFEKTGTNRQAELVNLILTSPAAL